MIHVAYIALGSNLGDRRANILAAVELLKADAGVSALCLSSLHETEPVGGPTGQNQYLNAAAQLKTTHEAQSLLNLMLNVENQLGRQRPQRWAPRVIDLDLLLYDDKVFDTPTLSVPHPRMHQRRFVLEPLAEIAGKVVHPTLGKTINDLLSDL